MSKELTIIEQENKGMKVIDSREVAEMLGKEHKYVIREIEGSKDGKTIGILPTLVSANFSPTNYFVESTYLDVQNKSRKCYLVTKMGCEILGNKQQGEKGILFTAKYVERFNKMEQALQEANQPKLPTTFKEALLMLVEAEEEKERLQLENESISLEKRLLSGEVFTWSNRSLVNALVRIYAQGDFSSAWVTFKKEILYKHSININSRITNHLNKTGKKTKPKTLDMLTDEEVPLAVSTIISMCNEKDIDISETIKHYSN